MLLQVISLSLVTLRTIIKEKNVSFMVFAAFLKSSGGASTTKKKKKN
jgi:hypothetical protein